MPRLSDRDKVIYLKRLTAYEAEVARRVATCRKMIADGNYPPDPLEHRVWLEQFAVGHGLDICSGNIPMEGAAGVDASGWSPRNQSGVLGPLDYARTSGEDLSVIGRAAVDFVISNYLEAFSSPLHTLNEWFRVVRKGGVLAVVVANAEHPMYRGVCGGPLGARHKASCFTVLTLRLYLEQAGFREIEIEKAGSALRAKAIKPQ